MTINSVAGAVYAVNRHCWLLYLLTFQQHRRLHTHVRTVFCHQYAHARTGAVYPATIHDTHAAIFTHIKFSTHDKPTSLILTAAATPNDLYYY